MFLSIYLSINVDVCLSMETREITRGSVLKQPDKGIYLSIYLSIYIFIYLFIYIFIYLSIYLFI
jgi:hypothetical protein